MYPSTNFTVAPFDFRIFGEIRMKHFTLKTIALACTLCIAAGVLAGTPLRFPAPVARAEEETPNAPEESASLFLPTSYEQYLHLNAPTDAAFCEDKIAIADGKNLYVYDGEEYGVYEHADTVTKIAFSGDGILYFADGTGALYRFSALSASSLVPDSGALLTNCSTFQIAGSYLYSAMATEVETNIARYPLTFSAGAAGEKFGRYEGNITPRMTFTDKLYCAVGNRVYTFDGTDTGSYYGGILDDTQSALSPASFTAFNGAYYYTLNLTDGRGGLYVTNTTGTSRQLIAGSGFSALSVRGESLCCVVQKSVREIDFTGETAAFSSYEITSSSESENRLNGATETVRAKNLIVTADAGNRRLSVYNSETKRYFTVPCVTENGLPYTPARIATDGEIIGVAEGNVVYVYEKDEKGNFSLSFTSVPNNEVSGVACIFGKCYFVTRGFGYGLASPHFVAGEICTRDKGEHDTPVALTADVYGNLYVTRADGAVFRYSEEEFLDPSVPVGMLQNYTLPNGFFSPQTDFEGNLYCMVGATLYQNGKAITTVSAEHCVYLGNEDSPVSFAICYEDGYVYYNFGNYLLRASAAIPNLSVLDAEDSKAEIFRAQDTLTLVSVSAGATGFGTDLNELKTANSPYFPYTHYYRSGSVRRGILLHRTNDYSVVALFEPDHKYTVSLFKTDFYITEVPREEYWRDEEGKQYLSSDVSLSLFPCLMEPLRGERVLRKNEVTLIGVVLSGETSDYEYAYVQTTAGEKGFIPRSFLTSVAPVGESETSRFAYLKESAEGVRFTSESGESLLVTARTRVQIYERENGLLAKIEKDGETYFAEITEENLEQTDYYVISIAIIVVLAVVAALVIGNYFFFRPIKRKREKTN